MKGRTGGEMEGREDSEGWCPLTKILATPLGEFIFCQPQTVSIIFSIEVHKITDKYYIYMERVPKDGTALQSKTGYWDPGAEGRHRTFDPSDFWYFGHLDLRISGLLPFHQLRKF